MNLYFIRRRTAGVDAVALQATTDASGRIGNEQISDRIRWIRTYVVDEADSRFGMVCIYLARNPSAIVDHADRVGMPADEFLPISETVVLRPDLDIEAA